MLVALLAVALVLNRTDQDPLPRGAPRFEGARPARVQRVVDGDTVRLAGIGSVRLIGVDTPEVYGERVECFGPEASAFARDLLRPGGRVRYRVGTEARDRYRRLLVYLWLPDGRLVNRLLVTRGYATTLTIAPNDQLAASFARAERGARAARRGIWGRPGCARGG